MAERLKRIRGYAFTARVDLAGLSKKLEAAGPWHWLERYSDLMGDYLSAKARDDYAMLKVYESDGGGYQLDIHFEADGADAEQQWASFHDDIRGRLLPTVGALGVQETETMR